MKKLHVTLCLALTAALSCVKAPKTGVFTASTRAPVPATCAISPHLEYLLDKLSTRVSSQNKADIEAAFANKQENIQLHLEQRGGELESVAFLIGVLAKNKENEVVLGLAPYIGSSHSSLLELLKPSHQKLQESTNDALASGVLWAGELSLFKMRDPKNHWRVLEVNESSGSFGKALRETNHDSLAAIAEFIDNKLRCLKPVGAVAYGNYSVDNARVDPNLKGAEDWRHGLSSLFTELYFLNEVFPEWALDSSEQVLPVIDKKLRLAIEETVHQGMNPRVKPIENDLKVTENSSWSHLFMNGASPAIQLKNKDSESLVPLLDLLYVLPYISAQSSSLRKIFDSAQTSRVELGRILALFLSAASQRIPRIHFGFTRIESELDWLNSLSESSQFWESQERSSAEIHLQFF